MNILEIAGGILALALAVALLALAIYGAVVGYWTVIARIEDRGEARAIEWQKNTLRSAAWWFSEDLPTMTMLMDLTNMEIYRARDRWREARAASPAAPEPTR